jgi:hypothetical protein
MTRRLLPVLVLWPLLSLSAQAGIFPLWHKDPHPTPAERVPQLLQILRTDGDEGKRAAAAEELHQFDPLAFPDIVPALLEVLKNDAKPSVRSEAAQTLGRLRPVSQQVGQALEQARDNDPSMRVRLQARRELVSYRWLGNYKTARPEPSSTSKEPPLAPPLLPAPEGRPVPTPAGVPLPPITTAPTQQVQKLPLPPLPVPPPPVARPLDVPVRGPELPPQY